MSTIFPLPSSPHCAPSTAMFVFTIRFLSYAMRAAHACLRRHGYARVARGCQLKNIFKIRLTTYEHASNF
jgi:hypothetical protein